MEAMVTQKWADIYAKERYDMGFVQGKLEALREVNRSIIHQSHPENKRLTIHFLFDDNYIRLFPPIVRESRNGKD